MIYFIIRLTTRISINYINYASVIMLIIPYIDIFLKKLIKKTQPCVLKILKNEKCIKENLRKICPYNIIKYYLFNNQQSVIVTNF